MPGIPGATGPVGSAGPVGAEGNTGASGPTGGVGATGIPGTGITVYHARGTAGRSTVVTNIPTAQPGVSVTFTIDQPATVMMWASIGSVTTQATAGASATVEMALYIDNTAATASSRYTAINGTVSAFGTGALTTVRTLPAGQHTIDLRTSRVQGNVAVNIGGNGLTDTNPGELTVLVMPPG